MERSHRKAKVEKIVKKALVLDLADAFLWQMWELRIFLLRDLCVSAVCCFASLHEKYWRYSLAG